jgi:hypothetical protein
LALDEAVAQLQQLLGRRRERKEYAKVRQRERMESTMSNMKE